MNSYSFAHRFDRRTEAAINPEVRLLWLQAIEGAGEKGIRLTPQAITLLTVMLESIADNFIVQTNYELPDYEGTVSDLQKRAIRTIVRALRRVARQNESQVVNSYMIMEVMPRYLPRLCPFEDPSDMTEKIGRWNEREG
jgi:hypothetical protein